MPFYFTIRKTAELLGVKVRTVRQWIRDGKIEETRFEGDRRIYISSKEIVRINAERSQKI